MKLECNFRLSQSAVFGARVQGLHVANQKVSGVNLRAVPCVSATSTPCTIHQTLASDFQRRLENNKSKRSHNEGLTHPR
jgi:hypothetical protein